MPESPPSRSRPSTIPPSRAVSCASASPSGTPSSTAPSTASGAGSTGGSSPTAEPETGVANPILVEVTRGSVVESRHRGAIVVVDAAGRRRFAIGDVEAPVFPRSAVKALQALPLVESGAADRYGFGPVELALASASHAGEPRHVEFAAAMLAAAGRSVADLECGAHMPTSSTAERALIRAGMPANPLHNNCSGKHAGFICVACHLGIDPTGLCPPRTSRPAGSHRGPRRHHRHAARRGKPRHRRLLDPDLCDSPPPPGAGLREVHHR